MLLPLLLQAAAPAAVPTLRQPTATEQRCDALAVSDPAAARAEAARWRLAGGGFAAERCAGLADAAEARWADAAARFEAGARAAELARDPAVADLWAQAGNAWLAAGEPARARGALDAALAAGTLAGQPLGEAQLDHARALVAAGDLEPARVDLDRALRNAPADPLAWLLSATLARRQGDVRRARADAAEALRRSPDDAQVQLEAGNAAALAHDEAGARAAWAEAARLAPLTPAGRAAVAALRQFDAPAATPPPLNQTGSRALARP